MKISSVDLSKITTYRFGGVCKNFIELESKEDLSKLSETVLGNENIIIGKGSNVCLLYTSPSPRDGLLSRMPSSA